MKKLLITITLMLIFKVSICQEKYLFYEYGNALATYQIEGKTKQTDVEVLVSFKDDDISSVVNISALIFKEFSYVVLDEPVFETRKDKTIMFRCNVIDQDNRILKCFLSVNTSDLNYYLFSIVNGDNILMFSFSRYSFTNSRSL